MGDVSEKINWALNVFDDFDGHDQLERGRSDCAREVVIVQILSQKWLAALIGSCVAIDSHNIESEGMQTLAHGAGSCAEIEGASVCGRRVSEKSEHKVVQACRCSGSNHVEAIITLSLRRPGPSERLVYHSV